MPGNRDVKPDLASDPDGSDWGTSAVFLLWYELRSFIPLRSVSQWMCVRVGGKGSGVGSRILFGVFYAIVSKVPNVPLEKGV